MCGEGAYQVGVECPTDKTYTDGRANDNQFLPLHPPEVCTASPSKLDPFTILISHVVYSYEEFLLLFCRTVAERTKPGERQDVEEKSYTFHAYGRTEGVAGVIVTDGDYPALVAHQLLSKIVDEFLAKHPRTSFSDPSLRENACPLPQLKEYIVKYQDPSQADSIMKIQQELDETKIVLHKTVCDKLFLADIQLGSCR